MKRIIVVQPSHWGEILQIPVLVFDDIGGQPRCRQQVRLVTLPCPLVTSRIELHLEESRCNLLFEEANAYPKAAAAAALAVQILGCDIGGTVTVKHLGIDVRSGLGAGRSSADVLGMLRAIAQAAGLCASHVPNFIGQVAQRIELGVDPLIFDHPVLYASREGLVIRHYYCSFPPLWVVAFAFNCPVDTVELARKQAREGFSPEHLAGAPMVIKLFEASLARRDPELLGKAATLSARLNQKLLPFPYFTELDEFAKKAGAGLSISNSGSVGALLLPRSFSRKAAARLASSLHRQFQCPTYIYSNRPI